MRRIVHKEEVYENPEDFVRECLGHLNDEIEYIIYFGVAKKNIAHPCKPNPSKTYSNILLVL